MKVDEHISELLYQHDCVIVPELGGFVANYAPAKIHPTKHVFTPPSKSISFNKHLKNNDGLLANRIATVESASYPEALKYIQHFTSDVKVRLKKGEKVTVADVGSLFMDVERNVLFEPSTTNFLLDAFGLAQFQSPAIKRDSIGKRIEKEFKDREPVPAEKKKSNIKRYVTLAIAAPLLTGLIWVSLKMDVFKNVNYSNLNPFAAKEISNVVPVKANDAGKTKVITSENLNNNTTEAIAKDTTQAVKLSTSQLVTTDLDNHKAVGIVKADSVKVTIKPTIVDKELKFHLVTGCFQVPENADRFVNTLQNQHVSASIIGKRNGLLVVSSGDFASREEAMAQLLVLKQSQPDAWLLEK